ncbi:LysR substrate-binding domain-containing protein [uncultured Cohaesibacter sp.]|uniref:LysR substrate-binding domain-containing protein n=1 Tax=uncultured Cohaesibacter sp. TaxID=1002546 RepID=UPI002931A59E|nr:LysR substrate-binding domain-containing protein [uncultured Cohaesibacter sp.]
MRHKQSPSVRQLQVFLAVIDEQGVSGAARKLGVSQPAVTNMIQSLEKEIGTILFRRIGRKMLLTEPGDKVARAARHALNETNRLLDSVKYATGNSVTPLRIGYSAPQMMLSAARKFRTAHPSVPLQFHAGNTSTLFELLDDYQVDLVSIGLSSPMEDYHCQLYVRQSLYLVMRCDDPLAHLDEIALEATEGLPFIMREEGSYTRKVFLDTCAQKGVRTNIALEIYSREATKEAVAHGFGYGTIPHREITQDPRFKTIPILGCEKICDEYFVCRKSALTFPPVKQFLDINSVVLK